MSDPGRLRQVRLLGETIAYRLVRARRRSIGMEVHLDGVTVRAPRWVPVHEIENALAERAEWLVRSVAEWRARRRDVMPRQWKSGAPILYRGRELALELCAARNCRVAADLFHLTVVHPAADDEAQISAVVRGWLEAEARALAVERVAFHVRRIARSAPALRLSNARSEWGSCNAKGEIRLNWRLVQLPPALAEYVIAHEVAHLVELNHSTRFWSLVEMLMPGHARLRRELDEWTALLAA